MQSGFIATVAAGSKGAQHVGVFQSLRDKGGNVVYYTPTKGKYAGKVGRTKIFKRVVISIPSMFEQQPVFDAVRKTIEAKFPERFDHHIGRAGG